MIVYRVYRVLSFLYGLDYYESRREVGFVEATGPDEARVMALAAWPEQFSGVQYDGAHVEGTVQEVKITRLEG